MVAMNPLCICTFENELPNSGNQPELGRCVVHLANAPFGESDLPAFDREV